MESMQNLLAKALKLQELQGSMPADISTDQKTDKCPICKGEEFIPGIEGRLKRCICVDAKITRERLKNSGLEAAFGTKTLASFRLEGRPPLIRQAHDLALRYTEQFSAIREEENNWLALLGQVGSGKTHLTIGIANALMAQNIGVVYMPYRDEITRIKQIITDESAYARAMSRYKNAHVLVVDDLFKEAVTRRSGEPVLNDSDLRIMFEILNHRYFKRLPVIISSEQYMNQLIDLDEGLGSRIFEMTRGRFIEFSGQELNFRLTG